VLTQQVQREEGMPQVVQHAHEQHDIEPLTK
jgi:hypothetical protein